LHPDPTCWIVHPAAIADLISRLEDLAVLVWFEQPIAADEEHRLVLDIDRMRALEAAAAIGTLAERADRLERRQAGLIRAHPATWRHRD
jgi:hypothetical protein